MHCLFCAVTILEEPAQAWSTYVTLNVIQHILGVPTTDIFMSTRTLPGEPLYICPRILSKHYGSPLYQRAIPLIRLCGLGSCNDELCPHQSYPPAHLCVPCIRVRHLISDNITEQEAVNMHELCRSNPSRHVRAHHFCTHRSADFHQCIIYDSGAADARLIGIEYIVTEKVSG
jgi:hypothetical protein